VIVAFIDAHRVEYGVEPICAQLPIAPSQYYEHKGREADATRLPPRLQRDRPLVPQIQRVYDENFGVYARARCGGSSAARISPSRAARWSV
jgi:putative transposase